jgi:tetratricopeptide (TPR) repeat protein
MEKVNMIKYIKKLFLLTLTIGLVLAATSCENYVQNIQKPIDDVGDDDLNEPSDVSFLITGVETAWAIAWDEHTVFADGLSDQLGFTRDISQATYPTFEQLDNAWREGFGMNPLIPQNNSTENIMDQLAQLRLYADTLIERVNNRITFTEDEMGIKQAGLYTGYFFGAVARYMWGAYWALDAGDGGGGVINMSPYIPASQMYSDALEHLDMALQNAPSDYEGKLINTFKARIYLIIGDYTNAAAAAAQGLQMGDPAFSALYNNVLNNYWYYWSGLGRSQWHVSPKMHDYVVENPQEAARIPLYQLSPNIIYSDSTYYQQLKYAELGASIRFLSWQENHLILAELSIRQANNEAGLTLINEVRAAYGIDALTADDITDKFGGDYLEMLIAERDKEFAFEGMRLIDQRRFGKWHLDLDKTWQHFPIGYDERQANPNL